jgi:hypothetical protein
VATHVDVQLIEGLWLPYEPGAEDGLLDVALDPAFNVAWQTFVALFPGQTLFPLFDDITVEELADLVDGVRVNGEEPPNPFVWFTLICEDEEVEAIVAALLARRGEHRRRRSGLGRRRFDHRRLLVELLGQGLGLRLGLGEDGLLLDRREWLGAFLAAQAAEQATALVGTPRRGRHLVVRGLADPALVVGAVGAQLAYDVALAARREVGLDPLPLEDRAAADVAGHVLMRWSELLGHGTPMLASAVPRFGGMQFGCQATYAFAASFSASAPWMTF